MRNRIPLLCLLVPLSARAALLSLDFQNVDLRALLQVMAAHAEMDVLITDEVKGTLDLHVRQIEWADALQLILKSRGLGMRREGSLMLIAPQAALLEQERRQLESEQTLLSLRPLLSRHYPLRYRTASDMAALIDGKSNERRQTLLSERGSILADPRGNTLVIHDHPHVHARIQDLLGALDVPVRQIEIEARIVEAGHNFSEELGVRLDFARTGKAWSLQGRLDDTGRAVDLPVARPTGAIAALFKPGASTLIALELQAMQAERRGRVISSPRVLTTDRGEALIEEGSAIPFTARDKAHDTHSTQFRKAVLSLKVKPHIAPDNTILLDIEMNKDSPDFARMIGETPALATKHLSTQVRIEDGGTVVIGGVYIDEEDHVTHRIPFLGDLPVVGRLFRQTRELKARRELMVFLTPRIAEEPAPAMGPSEDSDPPG